MDDLLDGLRDQFVDKDRSKRALVAFERWTIHKGESIPSYVSRYEQLMLELQAVGKHVDDEMLRVKFMAPLPADCRKFLGMDEPSSIGEAFQKAKNWARAEQFGKGDFS